MYTGFGGMYKCIQVPVHGYINIYIYICVHTSCKARKDSTLVNLGVFHNYVSQKLCDTNISKLSNNSQLSMSQ